jgi:dienelactone hydrolase
MLSLGGISQVLAEAPEGLPFRIKEVEIEVHTTELDLLLVVPYPMKRNLPAVVFLPGLMADVDQYQSYAEDLAARGILVAIHPWYSLLMPDVELAQNAKRISEWLTATLRVDGARIGIAGHSMGAKDAVLAQGLYGGFEAIVAIDPDDSGEVSAIEPYTRSLTIPLLLIGAELGWDAPDFCAPMDKNYQRFFEQSPPGTLEMTLIGADHVLMLDDPERLGYNLCRSGWADPASVHAEALTAMGLFFEEHLKVRRNSIPRLPGKAIRVRGDQGPEPLGPPGVRVPAEELPSDRSEESGNQPGSSASGS